MNIKLEGSMTAGFELEVERDGSKREYLVQRHAGGWTISEPRDGFSRRHLCGGTALAWKVIGMAVQYGVLAVANDLIKVRREEELARGDRT